MDDFKRSFDAMDWAMAFLEIQKEHPDVPTDLMTMVGWFANALMRGYDEAVNKQDAALAQREAEVLEACATLVMDINQSWWDFDDIQDVFLEIAAAIRARKETP